MNPVGLRKLNLEKNIPSWSPTLKDLSDNQESKSTDCSHPWLPPITCCAANVVLTASKPEKTRITRAACIVIGFYWIELSLEILSWATASAYIYMAKHDIGCLSYKS